MVVAFSGEVWHWRGPAPFYFVSVPPEHVREIKEIASGVTYGWGMVPARAEIGDTEWVTSLFPKDGGYIVPLKDRIRKAEGIELGDLVSVVLSFDLGDGIR